MALVNNGFRQATIGRTIGGTVISGVNRDALNKWNQSGRMDNCAIGEGYGNDGGLVSYPDDMNVPFSYHPMQTAGRIVSYSEVIGTGAMTNNLILTLQALADLSGQGDASAIGGLIVQLLADLSGNGQISSADMKAFLLMLADISGSGDLSGIISALAEMDANLGGSGLASSTIAGTGAMSANIVAYGDLTPEGIRDSIWNALSSQYQTAGPMGEKLNDAGAAGNPWAALLAANNDPETFGKLVQDIQALVDELHKIQGLNASAPMTVTRDNRIAGDITLNLTGDGENITTVTRE
jgi:hypothetical protein